MGEEFKRISRDLKYKGKIIEVYQDQVLTPSGHIAKWDYVHHIGAAAVVPVNEKGEILMVRQYRNSLDRYTLEIPAGGLDTADEPGQVCAARELEEETGFRSEQIEWLVTIRTTTGFCNEKIQIFTAKNLISSKQNLDEDEYINIEYHTLDELKRRIFSGEIEDSKTVAALLAYESKLK